MSDEPHDRLGWLRMRARLAASHPGTVDPLAPDEQAELDELERGLVDHAERERRRTMAASGEIVTLDTRPRA